MVAVAVRHGLLEAAQVSRTSSQQRTFRLSGDKLHSLRAQVEGRVVGTAGLADNAGTPAQLLAEFAPSAMDDLNCG